MLKLELILYRAAITLTLFMDIFRNTNFIRLEPIAFQQPCGMSVLRTNPDVVPGFDVGLELHSKKGRDLRWNGVVEIEASLNTVHLKQFHDILF